ncbi:MAG TPA: phosphate signaling complex protein PhoU [Deltaproteobacteria bacterium]|nr:phosphate signaling complex protein PhoU [Deltaproteobacteria bacterium]HOM27880.1 phosphate signaling complex protein PhoU [Deltaproteobacteria bacterium]HPP79763.1 phosphate signaling complex protein PhoU [Deltaproteobacteria bacterium]
MLEESKIVQLKKEITEFATLVESMVDKSVSGLEERRVDLLMEVIERDEPRANDHEMDIDERCVSIIAQHQPAGRPLRTVLMVSHINSTLERVADHAVTIAESALYLISRPPVKQLIDIPRMAQMVEIMIKDSITSFLNDDAELAKGVCERDDTVDGLRDQIVRELITYMTSDPATIERALHLMKITSNLERIADLATNICEDVIYMVKGKVIKHHKETL